MIQRPNSGWRFLTLTLSAAVLPAIAQPDDAVLSDAAQQLTGGSTRIWVLARTEQVLGGILGRSGPLAKLEIGTAATASCKEGAIYRFAKEGAKLTITECKAGQMVKSDHTWALKQTSPLDTVLLVDNVQAFTVLFRNVDGHPRLRLRAETASKITPDTDREFKLGAD